MYGIRVNFYYDLCVWLSMKNQLYECASRKATGNSYPVNLFQVIFSCFRFILNHTMHSIPCVCACACTRDEFVSLGMPISNAKTTKHKIHSSFVGHDTSLEQQKSYCVIELKYGCLFCELPIVFMECMQCTHFHFPNRFPVDIPAHSKQMSLHITKIKWDL